MTQSQKSHSVSSTIHYWSKWSQPTQIQEGGGHIRPSFAGIGSKNLWPCHTTAILSVGRNLDNCLITLITHDFSSIFLPLLSFCLWKHWHNAELERIQFLNCNFQLSCILCSCNLGTCQKCRTSGPNPDLLHQGWLFNKIPRWCIFILKFERCCFVSLVLQCSQKLESHGEL